MRRGRESNPLIAVLQTAAFPIGYRAISTILPKNWLFSIYSLVKAANAKEAPRIATSRKVIRNTLKSEQIIPNIVAAASNAG